MPQELNGAKALADPPTLDALIGQIGDPTLRHGIQRGLADLREGMRFGVDYSKHLPEVVRLPHYSVGKGEIVMTRDESDRTPYRVLAFTDRTRAEARVVAVGPDNLPLDGAEEVIVPASGLVVIRRFGEAIFPGLLPTRPILVGPGSDDANRASGPTHVAIKGENLHALQALESVYVDDSGNGLVDLIYIDPPYNTGNKSWIYNDKYVSEGDRDSSSKWVGFMARRLQVAQRLLKPTGVIFVAIGDAEHHRLRLLMDRIFGPENFISDIVWQGGRKNDSRYVSNGADYMLVYARNEEAMRDSGVRWRESRAGVAEILEAGESAWREAVGDTPALRAEAAEKALKEWQRRLPRDHPARSKGLADYNKIDESGEVYRKKDISWPGGGGPRYDVLHPITGLPVKVPGRGWIFSTPERMQAEIESGRVLFGEDHNAFINRKSFLRESDSMGPESVFIQKRTGAGQRLHAILGDKRFPFPKDHEVLMRWIKVAASKDAIILDFFGGSGSTMEAVIRLNAEDDGTRQCILVTNNEVGETKAKDLKKKGHLPGDHEWEQWGVSEYVTRPRIETIVSGIRPDGSAYSEGLPARVAFFDLVHLDPSRVKRRREFEAISPLLWMQGGARGPLVETVDDEQGFTVTEAYAVLFDMAYRREFAEAVEKSESRVRFLVTDSDTEFEQAAALLPGGARPDTTVRLYSQYLANFQTNTTKRR